MLVIILFFFFFLQPPVSVPAFRRQRVIRSAESPDREYTGKVGASGW